jgi:maleamate amidohydrolase
MPDFGGQAGFGSRPAVVVVDLNLGFTDPASPLACDLDDVLVATRALLDVARARGVPVLFTTIVYDEVASAAAAVFLRKVPALRVLAPGTRWVEIDERLGRRPEEPVIAKAHASAFFGVPLAALLAGRDTLVVCGASTSGCVRATVVDAFSKNYRVAVVADACFDRLQSSHALSLVDMNMKYADVVSSSEAAAYLESVPPGQYKLPEGRP